MDPAYVLEQAMIARQKPMDEVIEQGDSPVQLFYKDTTVFLTGGSGFVGKQLLEKLLRSCEIKKVYLLLRSKKENTIHQRLEAILSDTLYDKLRRKKPQFAEKLVPVEGDVADIRLGLSDKDWHMLAEEVNVIFHVAATVNFHEPLKKATLINVRGTREALALARECKNLKCFNYTSTAFAHTTKRRINQDVEEKFYQTPVSPDVMIKLVETVDEKKLDSMTPKFIADWPNTYTFTKAIAEELIRNAQDLPVCIVKPPVVVTTYVEPVPGWIDFNACFSNPIGGILAVGLGIMHVLLVNADTIVSYAPVDYVNNAIIVANWDATENKKKGVSDTPIYTVSSSKCNTQWKSFGESLRSEEFLRLASPKVVWYTFAIETSNDLMFWLLTWLLHYIPGYAIDALVDLLGVRPKGIPPLIKIYTRIYKLAIRYKYFTFNFWNIRDDNLKAMIQRMSPQDRLIYNCDISTIDLKEQMKVWCIGIRRDFIKDNLQGADYGYKKIQYLKYANYVAAVAYAYLIYIFFYMIYITLATIINFLFNMLS